VKKVRLLVTAFLLILVPFILFAGESPRTGNIAVASNEKAAASPVADRMGRSPFYLIYDRDGTFIRAADNPNFGKRGGPGGTSAIDSIGFDEKGAMTGAIITPSREEREQTWNGFSDFFTGNGITAVVAETFGDEIVRGMKAKGIECIAFKGTAEQAVESILERAQNRGHANACDENGEACTVPSKVPILQKRISSARGEKE
jgi:predicted Fe-Mo cluster-binding NifX family protein